jgi:uncharacterized protein YrrD
MERTVLLQKNANVVNASGRQIGSLVRVVLHPETKVITDIVVQSGALLNKAYRVVPIDQVADTTQDQIILRNASEDLESFPPFEEERIVTENEGMFTPPTDVPKVIYGVPGMAPAVLPGPEDQMTTRVEQNIPEGTVALKEGAKVFTADDQHIGNLERILADPAAEQATHLIITRGMLTKEKRLIPMKWVTILGEDSVHLGVTEAEVNEFGSASPGE